VFLSLLDNWRKGGGGTEAKKSLKRIGKRKTDSWREETGAKLSSAIFCDSAVRSRGGKSLREEKVKKSVGRRQRNGGESFK